MGHLWTVRRRHCALRNWNRSGRGLIRVLARASRIILDPVPIDGAHPGVVCGLGFVRVAAPFAVRVSTAQPAVVARARLRADWGDLGRARDGPGRWSVS